MYDQDASLFYTMHLIKQRLFDIILSNNNCLSLERETAQ